MSDLENFSFLLPGELAGMAYPHADGAFDELHRLGFRSMVSLSRRAPPPDALGDLVHLHCPLADFTRIPTLDLRRVIAFISRAPQPIVIHGEGGIGRTGVVLACRLVSLGRSARQAVAEVRRARPGSIDDPELEASVEDYEHANVTASDSATASPFNFASASHFDRIVHGAECPGLDVAMWSASGVRASVSHGPSYARPDPNDSRDSPIETWLGFMARQGIREVVCLLDDGDLSSYKSPLLHRYQREFLRVTHVPIESDAPPSREAIEQALAALQQAESGDAPVVVHCIAGLGNTGVVLAAWLRARYGLDPLAAIAIVQQHARCFGAERDPLEAGPAILQVLEGLPELR